MKRSSIFTLLLAILSFTNITAQGDSFDDESIVITAGLGVPDFERIHLKNRYYNNGYSSVNVRGFGPFIFKLDYGFYRLPWGHTVGAGVQFGYSASKLTYNFQDYWNNGNNNYYYTYSQTDRISRTSAGVRGTYHFLTREVIDIYLNGGIGLTFLSNQQTINDYNGTRSSTYRNVDYYTAITAGLRYYFFENIGLYTEIGWDLSAPVQAGISIKM